MLSFKITSKFVLSPTSFEWIEKEIWTNLEMQ
jgi:hypothetical protein